MNVDTRALGWYSKLDASNNLELVWFECNRGRYPVIKILGIDADLVRKSCLNVVKVEVSVFGGYDGAPLAAGSEF
jgi:hypothetical protein